MSEQSPRQATGNGPKLVVTWLVVGVPLVYGIVQTARSVVPLFTG